MQDVDNKLKNGITVEESQTVEPTSLTSADRVSLVCINLLCESKTLPFAIHFSFFLKFFATTIDVLVPLFQLIRN